MANELEEAPLVAELTTNAWPEFKKYGEEIARAELQNGILDVPSGFFGLPVGPLWCHHNYLLLDAYIDECLRAPPRNQRKGIKRHFHIVGTPGIGKTYYGHLRFYREAKLKNRVIWRTKAGVYVYYDFSLVSPFFLQSTTYVIPRGWDMSSVWLVVDGASKAEQHMGLILQCVSPHRAGYWEFAKDVGRILYLEAWNLDDLKLCNEQLQLGFTDADVERRYHFCGGLPRLVFDADYSLEDLEEEMRMAATRAPSWKAVVKQVDISDYLVHFKLPSHNDLNIPLCHRVTKKVLIFGSEYIEQLAYDMLKHEGFEAAREFVNCCQEVPQAQSMGGTFLEKHFHRALVTSKEGLFKIKALSDYHPTSSLRLAPTSHKRLRSWEVRTGSQVQSSGFNIYERSVTKVEALEAGKEEFQGLSRLPGNCFVEPFSAIQKSFDSLLLPDKIFQATLSMQHKVFWSAIKQVVDEYDLWHAANNVPLPPYYSLIFVVPESNFQGFREQGYKKDDGSDYKIEVAGMNRVRQFALAFPWTIV